MKGAKDGGIAEAPRIRRFSAARIVEHSLAIAVVGTLVVTGLSQKFYELEVSQWFFLRMQGVDNVRIAHRYAGVVFAAMSLLHIAIAVGGVILRKWQPTMVINKNDFLDAVHNIRYYIGFEEHPARCGRYDYKQKFGYWAIIVGGFFMVATGLILWFPAHVARFISGEVIPVSKALHSNEGLLIFLIIAVWHVYDSIFSPDVFPLDGSIFTGYISRRRMLREHPLELAEIEGASAREDKSKD